MTTKKAGGKITGLLALTMEAQVALRVGELVHITGDYEVTRADGTRPVLGHISVSNHNRRISDAFSTSVDNPEVPGDVTVEARGLYVKDFVADGVIAAGTRVRAVVAADGTSRVAAFDAAVAGADVSLVVGVALTGAAAAGERIDVLVN